LTASAMQGDRERALSAGFSAYGSQACRSGNPAI
jgi:CheY-like chemotaxis protein